MPASRREDVTRGIRLLLKNGNFGAASVLAEPIARLDSKGMEFVALSYIRAGNLQAGAFILKSLSDSGNESSGKLLRRVLAIYQKSAGIVEFDPLGFFGKQGINCGQVQKVDEQKQRTEMNEQDSVGKRRGRPPKMNKKLSATRDAKQTRLGELVRMLRAKLGITQRDLDEKVGVKPQYTAKIEAGRIAEPKPETARRIIIDAFGKNQEIQSTPEFIELRKLFSK